MNLIAITCSVLLGNSGKHVAYETKTLNGKKCEVITANIESGLVAPGIVLAKNFPGGDEDFAQMVKRPNLLAAVNGTYFDKNTKKPIGDIWFDGTLQNFGAMGTVFCFGSDQDMDIRRVERHRTQDWSAWWLAIGCGPALILDGKIDVKWKEEGFRDPAVLNDGPRMGIGYTSSGKLLLVYCKDFVSFEGFAKVMKAAGCYEAMNLDSGASLAMWYKGKTIKQAGRKLTNLITIEAVSKPN